MERPLARAKLKEPQGVNILSLVDADVKILETMKSVGRDCKTMGEIVLRGSSIMKGYHKDTEATSKEFKNGWFLTGDVGVIHLDGYIEIKDRSKDIIISGGKNISSVGMEIVLYAHPRVLEEDAVAMPHIRWGESPCAFLILKDTPAAKTGSVDEAELISYCRKKLPGFMVPKKVVFVPELQKTSTGKVVKSMLRILVS